MGRQNYRSNSKHNSSSKSNNNTKMLGKYNSSRQNCISKCDNSNNKNIKDIEGDIQFPSRSKPVLSDQQSRFQNNSSNPKTSISKDVNNNNDNNSLNTKVANLEIGNKLFPLNDRYKLYDQKSRVSNSYVKQFPLPNYKEKQNCLIQN